MASHPIARVQEELVLQPVVVLDPYWALKIAVPWSAELAAMLAAKNQEES